MKQIKMAFIIVILFVGLISLSYGNVIFQEGNPLPILISIIKLELSNQTFQQVSETNNKVTYISKNRTDSRNSIVKNRMKELGWNFREQMGAALIFEKEEVTKIVETRLYSKYYFLWHVPN